MFAVLQTPVGVFVLRSPGLCHRDSCVTTKEMLCFPPSKSHIEGNLHNSPWNWGLAQIGELPRGHISEVRTSKAEPGLGLLCQCLQARSWEVFSRVVPLPLCVYSAHPLLCSGNCCGAQTANRLHTVRAGLRHGFERSMDLLWCVVCTMIRDTEDTVCEMSFYVQ